MTDRVCITRHPALVTYLLEVGLIDETTPVVAHATPANVAGKHVLGVLPLRLAVLADRVTEIPLDIPADLRGSELTIEQVREFAGEPETYRIDQMGEWWANPTLGPLPTPKTCL